LGGDGFGVRCPVLGAQKQVVGGGAYADGAGFGIGRERLALALNLGRADTVSGDPLAVIGWLFPRAFRTVRGTATNLGPPVALLALVPIGAIRALCHWRGIECSRRAPGVHSFRYPDSLACVSGIVPVFKLKANGQGLLLADETPSWRGFSLPVVGCAHPYRSAGQLSCRHRTAGAALPQLALQTHSRQ
jgi:hypothetical protein